jgi:Pyridoxamine 5'-phosphate oxidase
MPDTLDLTGDIAAAVDGAAMRGATLALAYVREDGSPSVSFRGSTQVHGPGELALWARKRDSGLALAIAEEPRVSLVYYGPDGPGPMFLAIEGRARVAPEINEQVWAAMIEGERQQDPGQQGVAVLIEVDTVAGAGPEGYFQLARS